MSYDVFSDLQEWGRVLDQIQKMRADGAFDDHQQGLARLARYPFNWQLRQGGAILAGHAVSGVLHNGNGTISERARSQAAKSIRGLLAQPQPPVLHAFAGG